MAAAEDLIEDPKSCFLAIVLVLLMLAHHRGKLVDAELKFLEIYSILLFLEAIANVVKKLIKGGHKGMLWET